MVLLHYCRAATRALEGFEQGDEEIAKLIVSRTEFLCEGKAEYGLGSRPIFVEEQDFKQVADSSGTLRRVRRRTGRLRDEMT